MSFDIYLQRTFEKGIAITCKKFDRMKKPSHHCIRNLKPVILSVVVFVAFSAILLMIPGKDRIDSIVGFSFDCGRTTSSFGLGDAKKAAWKFLSAKSILERTRNCSRYMKEIAGGGNRDNNDFPIAFGHTLHQQPG